MMLPAWKPRCAKTGLALALLMILGCIVFILKAETAFRAQPDEQVRPNRMLEMIARYTVGARGVMQMSGQWNVALIEPMLADMKQLMKSPEDTLRVLLLRGWLTDQWPEDAALMKMTSEHPSLVPDVKALGQMKAAKGDLPDDVWASFHGRHGWIAELVRAQTRGSDHASHQLVTRQGMSTMVILVGAMMLGLMVGVGGLVLLILGITRWRRGLLVLSLARPGRAEGGVLLEGFALYMVLFLLLPWLVRFSPVPLPGWAAYAVVTLSVVVGMIWPLLRGMAAPVWREILGLHRGRGFLKEMGCGVLGWLAALPLMAVGMIAASWIMRLTDSYPSHPIVDAFAGDGMMRLGAVLLAAVWAPITEEVMFRGLLFPGLSAWMRWLLGLVGGAFIFAVIHPQGWAGVPAIMVLASAFSVLRLWRQSLVAPMTAHALNNGLLCLVMLLIW